jgi:transposase
MNQGIVAGIDWASDVHVACVLDAGGAVVARFSFAHDSAAIMSTVRRLRAAGVGGVAIERGDGPVVEELLDAGLPVFVVPSRQIKGLRTRYGSAGNKDDRFDAYVLADTLRTDGHRWKPLRPDTPPTRALRALCRSRKDLVETRVQILGQLRANLELAFPGAIGLFTKPASGISLAFLRRFPTARKAAWLSPARMPAWPRSAGYPGGVSAAVLHGRLTSAAPGLDGAEGEARGQITLALAVMLTALNNQITVLDQEIAALFAAHPDPVTALPMIMRWISDVPSKIENLVEAHAVCAARWPVGECDIGLNSARLTCQPEPARTPANCIEANGGLSVAPPVSGLAHRRSPRCGSCLIRKPRGPSTHYSSWNGRQHAAR